MASGPQNRNQSSQPPLGGLPLPLPRGCKRMSMQAAAMHLSVAGGGRRAETARCWCGACRPHLPLPQSFRKMTIRNKGLLFSPFPLVQERGEERDVSRAICYKLCQCHGPDTGHVCLTPSLWRSPLLWAASHGLRALLRRQTDPRRFCTGHLAAAWPAQQPDLSDLEFAHLSVGDKVECTT